MSWSADYIYEQLSKSPSKLKLIQIFTWMRAVDCGGKAARWRAAVVARPARAKVMRTIMLLGITIGRINAFLKFWECWNGLFACANATKICTIQIVSESAKIFEKLTIWYAAQCVRNLIRKFEISK